MARTKIFHGDRLMQARKAAGMTQDDLAAAIGGSTAQVARYENGKSEPSPDVTVRLVELLKVSVDWLYGLTNDQSGHFIDASVVVTPMERRLIEAYRNGDLRELMRIASEQNAPKTSKPSGAVKGKPTVK